MRVSESGLAEKKEGTVPNICMYSLERLHFQDHPTLNSERCRLIFAMLPECMILVLPTCFYSKEISSRMVWNEAEDHLSAHSTVCNNCVRALSIVWIICRKHTLN